MRRFIDLHLRPPPDTIETEKMLVHAVELGFKGVAVTFDRKPSKSVRELALDLGLDLVYRVDLQPRNPAELTAMLKRVRRSFEIVSVECHGKAVARQAAKDHRVDILNFHASVSSRRQVRFDRQEASLALDANCSYEINLLDLIRQGPMAASRLISLLRGEVENARKFNVPIIISSGAREPLLMREPRGLAAVADLFDVGEEEGLNMVSTNPWKLVEENREKLGAGFVVPGVKVV